MGDTASEVPPDAASADGSPVLRDLPGSLAAEMASLHERERRVWADVAGSRPSFQYKLRESQRQLAHLAAYGVRPAVWDHNSKPNGYRLARRCGLRHPERLLSLTTLAAIDHTELPNRFVLKPYGGSFARGVFVLERQSVGVYLDHLDQREKTWERIVEDVDDLLSRGRISEKFVVEEFLRPHPECRHASDLPDDWKVFCFYDRPAVMMQRRTFGSADTADWRFKFWSSDGVDLGEVNESFALDSSLSSPADRFGLLAAAVAVGRELRSPFCRIDFYETDRGIVFGEITPHPGGPLRWRPDLDELLGREWELAEARLAVEGPEQLSKLRPQRKLT